MKLDRPLLAVPLSVVGLTAGAAGIAGIVPKDHVQIVFPVLILIWAVFVVAVCFGVAMAVGRWPFDVDDPHAGRGPMLRVGMLRASGGPGDEITDLNARGIKKRQVDSFHLGRIGPAEDRAETDE